MPDHTLFITSPLEPENVERIRAVAPAHIGALYEPDLLLPRYIADHKGGPFTRTREQTEPWRVRLGLPTSFSTARNRRLTVFANIVRGNTIDEPAMTDALRSGHLGFAALDVTTVEPLPTDSPLWDMPNLLICPHSATTVATENARITALFCENLDPLREWPD